MSICSCPTCGGEMAGGRRYCSLDCYRLRRHLSRDTDVPESLAEQFPHFDLSVLSEKQLAVLEMRLGGNLSWRKIAAFEGTTHAPIRRRYLRAVAVLQDSIKGHI